MSLVMPFGFMRAVAAAFSPADIPGLQLWLKPDAGVLDASGNPCTNGVAVATWQDQSGNGRHVAQATSGNRPTYGVDRLNFAAASSQYLVSSASVPVGDACTVVAVSSVTSVPAAYAVVHSVATNGMRVLAGPSRWYADNASRISSPADSGIAWTGGFQVTALRSQPGETRLDVDASSAFLSTATTAVSMLAAVAVGARLSGSYGLFFNGSIREICVYSSYITNQQLADLRAYIAAKYA